MEEAFQPPCKQGQGQRTGVGSRHSGQGGGLVLAAITKKSSTG